MALVGGLIYVPGGLLLDRDVTGVFEVYDLSDAIRSRFMAVDARLLEHYPKRPDYRDDWQTEHWKEAPMAAAFEKYLSFALSGYDVRSQEGLSDHFAAVRAALQRAGTYFAYFKYDHGDNPGNIDLFIVDLEEDLVYIINHNT